MKAHSLLIIAILAFTSIILIGIGCKYDVAEPKWDSPPESLSEVTISDVVPPQALAGVNYITINGSNFSGALDTNVVTNHVSYTDSSNVVKDTIVYSATFVYNGVYFDNVQAKILEITPTMIKVNRPPVASNNCSIKIVSNNALKVQKHTYRIDLVMEAFGAFVSNDPLTAIDVDNAGNIYVAKGSAAFSIFKITPSGDKTMIGVAPWAPSDAQVGPDGNLYYLNNVLPTGTRPKQIRMVYKDSLLTADTLWYTVGAKNISVGDFAANGDFYSGGRRTSILVIRPNLTQRVDAFYATDTIQAMRVYNNYLYVATPSAIFRHSLSDTSVIGAQQQIINLNQGILASARPLKAFSFSVDGSKLLLGTDSKYPVLIADATTIPITIDKVEPLYIDILPANCKQFCFGQYLYCILGNGLYRIDVGTTGVN